VILIPVKNLASAKQRLAGALDQHSRTELAQTMLRDVVEAVSGVPNRPPCALVTSDTFAVELARLYDLEVIPDLDNPGETAAIEMATSLCISRGIHSTLVIPADIPLIQPQELEQILANAQPEGSLLVPAADGRGTNAAFRRPANLFPLRFGNDSFKPHLAAARATGKPCTVLKFPGIGLDMDNPSDLADLLSQPGATWSQTLLRQWRLDGRLAARESL
jgi:2-phospho-L-lactate/phosphoenolpyruvate guanylyltransferase